MAGTEYNSTPPGIPRPRSASPAAIRSPSRSSPPPEPWHISCCSGVVREAFAKHGNGPVLARWLAVSTLVYACTACSSAKPAAPQARTTGVMTGFRIGHTEIVSPRAPHTQAPLHDGYPMALVDPHPLTRVLRGDFEPPARLLIAYEEDWLDSIQQIIVAAEGQARVLLLATPAQTRTSDFQRVSTPAHVDVLARDLDSPWVRDYGPLQTYELDSGPLWLDFSYAWDRPMDDRFPSALSNQLHARVEHPTFELDGGAVISNGGGLCALTRTSLIDAGFTEPDSPERELFL